MTITLILLWFLMGSLSVNLLWAVKNHLKLYPHPLHKPLPNQYIRGIILGLVLGPIALLPTIYIARKTYQRLTNARQ